MALQSDLKLLALVENDQLTTMDKSIANSNTQLPPSPAPLSALKNANEVEQSHHNNGNASHKVITLEQRYIQLLEQRIASLEAQLEDESLEQSDSEPASDQGEDKVGEDENNHEESKESNTGAEKEQSGTTDLSPDKVDSSETVAPENNQSSGRIQFSEATAPDSDDPENGQRDRVEDPTTSTDSRDSDKTPGEKSYEAPRILCIDRRYDEKGIQVDVTTNDASSGKDAPADNTEIEDDYAFTWMRVFDTDNKYQRTEVEIQSKALVTLLRDNLTHHIEFPHHGKRIRLLSPFRSIVHNWTTLLSEREPRSDDNSEKNTGREDLKRLMDRVSTLNELKGYFQDLDPDKPSETVTFELLWTIFPPGCLVYSKDVMQQEQVLILQYFEEDEHKGNKKRLLLTCWAYDWDGENFNRVPYDLYIESFPGTKPVNTLNHYPIDYHRGSRELYKRLVNRGKRYRELCTRKSGAQMFDYHGESIEDQKGVTRQENSYRNFSDRSSTVSSSMEKSATEPTRLPRIQGRIIIDFSSYNQYVDGGGRMGSKHPAEAYGLCNCATFTQDPDCSKTYRNHYDGIDGNTEFTDEQYLICPPRVLGFFMVKKTWAQLLVDKVHDIGKNKGDAFNKLVLDVQQKNLIKSLVSRHGEDSESGEGGVQQVKDIVEGKGKGVVILLHGPPGVGKSLTAESVAQITNKPLFAVSVADIGLKPAEVEVNLSQLFDLASLWKAVLLFDEADVFLEARDKSDMERNALVSVLLRVMEYYEGILILTTNRIRTFDVAVQSRVHLAVRYQDLTVEDRKKVFKTFYNQLTRENCSELTPIQEYIDDFEEELNGRQIRNVFSSAMALARERNEKVCLKDFKQVVKVTRDFQKYLTEESVRARQRME